MGSLDQDHAKDDAVLLPRVKVDGILDSSLTPELEGVSQEIQHALPDGTILVVPELKAHAAIGNRIEFSDDLDVDLIGGRPVPTPQLNDPQLLDSTLRRDQTARHESDRKRPAKSDTAARAEASDPLAPST